MGSEMCIRDSGMEVCTQPVALHKTRTCRRLCGAASGLSGKAAIMAEMSEGLANCLCGQPRVNPPVKTFYRARLGVRRLLREKHTAHKEA